MSNHSRRAILAGIATAPALAAPAFALSNGGPPDPIFAAIERHRAGLPRRIPQRGRRACRVGGRGRTGG